MSLAAGILNAWVLQSVMPAEDLPTGIKSFTPTALVRFAADLSLAAWITALFLGRRVGYL